MNGPQPVDLVVPYAPKDFAKLPYFVRGVRENIQIETIHVITPDPAAVSYEAPGVVFHADDEVFPYDRSLLRYRPSWCWQQMAKIWQDVTEHNWFLVMDGDIIPANPIPLWADDGRPIYYMAKGRQLVPAYFHFLEAMVGFNKVFAESFLSECVLYSKKLMRDMLRYAGITLDEWWQRAVEITSKWCHIADGELYGSFVYKVHRDVYDFRYIRRALGGRYGQHTWSPAEIEAELRSVKSGNPGVQLISIHTWADQW